MQQTQTELAIYADARLFSNPIPLMPHRRKSRILLWLLVALFVFAVIGTIAFQTVQAPLEAWLQGQILVAFAFGAGSRALTFVRVKVEIF